MSKKAIADLLTNGGDFEDFIQSLYKGDITEGEFLSYASDDFEITVKDLTTLLKKHCISNNKVFSFYINHTKLVKPRVRINSDDVVYYFSNVYTEPFVQALIEETDFGLDSDLFMQLVNWLVDGNLNKDYHLTLKSSLSQYFSKAKMVKSKKRFELGVKYNVVDWDKVSRFVWLNEDFCAKYLSKLNWSYVLVCNKTISDDFIVKHQEDILATHEGKPFNFEILYNYELRDSNVRVPRVYSYEVITKLGNLFNLADDDCNLEGLSRYYDWDFLKHFNSTHQYIIDLAYGLTNEDLVKIASYAKKLVDEHKADVNFDDRLITN